MSAGSLYAALRARLENRYLELRGYGSGRAFTRDAISSCEEGDIFLDVGCGEAKLRRLLQPGVHYVGLDRYLGEQANEYADWTMRPSVIGDVHQLPIASDCCGAVALMHVLEHVHNPSGALKEISRVLRPNGRLFVDVPFFHPIHHAPHDYYRYTPFALAVLAKSAGLEVIEIKPSGGYFRALGRILEEAPSVIRGKSPPALLTRLVFAYPLAMLGWVISRLQYLLDLQDDTQNITCGYHCVFRKPGANDRE